MSLILDRILIQAATMYPATVALSPKSVTVLLFASGFLEQKRNWLDEREDPLDEITVADWDEIEKLVANTYEEIMTPIIGWTFPFITAAPPDNCLECDGSIYDRVDFPALYDSLDTVFRIDADTFFVPDLRSRVPIGAGTGTGLSTYAVNETGGEEAHSLTANENGSHQHGIFTGTGLQDIPVGAVPIKTPSLFPTDLTDLSGLGTPHENRQPFLALRWAVVAQ